METYRTDDLWESLGELDEVEKTLVLTGLFEVFETRLAKDSADESASDFFHQLHLILERTRSCNLNRR